MGGQPQPLKAVLKKQGYPGCAAVLAPLCVGCAKKGLWKWKANRKKPLLQFIQHHTRKEGKLPSVIYAVPMVFGIAARILLLRAPFTDTSIKCILS